MIKYLPIWNQQYVDGSPDDPERIYNQFVLSFQGREGDNTHSWSKKDILDFWDSVIGDDNILCVDNDEHEKTRELFKKIRNMIDADIEHFIEMGLLKEI